MVGNLGMITLICLNAQLHTPMYYFLSNLSFVDLCYSSVITPKMLVNFVSGKTTISYAGCMARLYFFLVFVIAECYLKWETELSALRRASLTPGDRPNPDSHLPDGCLELC